MDTLAECAKMRLARDEKSVGVPEWLLGRTFSEDDAEPLRLFAQSVGIRQFGEIGLKHLQQYEREKQTFEVFSNLLRNLGLLGVRLPGKAAKFCAESPPIEQVLVCNPHDRKELALIVEDASILFYLQSIGIKKRGQLNGIVPLVLSYHLHRSEENIREALDSAALRRARSIEEYLATLQLKPQALPESSVAQPKQDWGDGVPMNTNVPDILDRSVFELGFGTRVANVLQRLQIATLRELLCLDRDQVLNVKSCGQKSVTEIEDRLEELGLSLAAPTSAGVGMKTEMSDLPIDTKNPILHYPITALRLHPKLHERLLSLDICTLGELVAYSEIALKRVQGFGLKRLLRVKSALQEYGIRLGSRLQSRGGSTYELTYKPDGFLYATAPPRVVTLRLTETFLSDESKKYLSDEGFIFVCDLLNRGLLWLKCRPQVFQECMTLFGALKLPCTQLDLSEAPSRKETFEWQPQLDEIREAYHWFASVPRVSDDILRFNCDEREAFIFARRGLEREGRATLEEVARELGLTRERVRQIARKIDALVARSIASEYYRHYVTLRRQTELDGGVLETHALDSTIWNSENETYLTALFALASSRMSFDSQGKAFTGLRAGDRGRIAERVLNSLQGEDMSGIRKVERSQLLGSVRDVTSNFLLGYLSAKNAPYVEKLLQRVANDIAAENFTETADGALIPKSFGAELQVLEAFKRLYPEGAHIYRKENEIFEAIVKEVPVLQDRGSRYVTGACTRSEQIWLWGHGFYIHKDNISLDPEISSLIHRLNERVVQYFEQGICDFKIDKIWEEYDTELKKQGVPTKQALYSLMRAYPHPLIVLEDYPRIWSSKQGPDAKKQVEIAEEYVEDRNGEVPWEDLYEHFVEQRGYARFHLEQMIARSAKLMKGPNKTVITKATLAIDRVNLAKLGNAIAEEVSKHDKPLHLKRIKRDFGVLWNKVACRSLTISQMAKLLGELEIEGVSVFHGRLVSPEGIQDPALVAQINEWALEQRTFVTRNELEREFCKERGYDQPSINSIIPKTDLVLNARDEFVHEDLLGLDNAQQAEIENILLTIANEAATQAIPTCTFERVLVEYEGALPPLNNELFWTEELLAVFAARNDGIMVFHKAFMAVDNELDIEDFDDLVGYIIARYFADGTAPAKNAEKLLRSHRLITSQGLLVRRDDTFFDGSSIEFDENAQQVHLSKIGRKRYLRND